MLRRTEIAVFCVILVVVAWLGVEFCYRGYLKPILQRSSRLKAQVLKIRSQKQWIRGLKAKVAQMERKLRTLQPLVDELQVHLVREESDRIRITVAREQAARGLKDLIITPVDVGSPPARLSFRNPVDPNEQLNKLRQTFSKDYARATFTRWTIPGAIEVLRYSERVTIEGPFKDFLRFLGRLEGDQLLVEVTDLKISGAKPEPGKEEFVTATMELSAPCLPQEETGAEGQD